VRISLEVDWEGWRWARRWHRVQCWFAGHPRFMIPAGSKTAAGVILFSWAMSGLCCIRCGARPPHYEEPLFTHLFSWSEKPFGQLETHLHEEASAHG